MGGKMRQALTKISKKLHHGEQSDSSSDSEDLESLPEISPKIDDELLCFLVLYLENQKVKSKFEFYELIIVFQQKGPSQMTPLDQIHAALPKINSSPHATLLDRLTDALNHSMKYPKITHLVQTEISGCSKIENGNLLLSMAEWDNVQMLANVLVHQYDEPLLHVLLVKCNLNRAKGKILEAVEWARRGVSQCDEDTPDVITDLLKKSLAIALSTAAARSVLSQNERTAFRNEAVDLLTELGSKYENDAIIHYNLSVILAEKAKYSAATKAIKAAMASSSGSFDPCWALYSLILSSNREYDMALTVIDGGLKECSKLYEPLLLIVKARLMISSGSQSDGINLLANACSQLKTKKRSEEESPVWEEIDKQQQAILWRELTQMYILTGRMNDAEYAITELEQLVPNKPETLSIKGDVHQAQGRIKQAIQLYEVALSIDPNQESAMLSLGKLYRVRAENLIAKSLDGSSDLIMAQSLLSRLVQVQDSGNYEAWRSLGLICKAQGRLEEAKKHLQYATSLASFSPVKSFRSLPRLF